MRVPLGWIKEYVDWTGTVEELAEALTMSGTEVEAVGWVGAPRQADNLARFVIGRVFTREQHPNADKLSLCRVDVGEAGGGVRQIVCGAANFAAGDTVAVALSGAVLENGLKLKKANLRGVESDGMMLSEQELGFEEKSPGIAVLPDDCVVGEQLQDYLPVSEAVLELELTSNRPDCFSMYGIAREAAAAARLHLAPPPTAEPAVLGGAPAEESVAVEVADADLCPRYGARVIRGVKVGESPVWLKARLMHAGMRPINNVVDVTNYVMLAWGQPLHAFDAGKIRGDRLIARRAKPGERIVTLDEVERTLDGEMLVIADVERPLVIAGVFGSVDAEVDERTTDIVLEAANFNGPNILRTEMHTGIRSEASNRFEKGLDTNLVPGSLAYASRLLAELCEGTVAPGTVDVHGELPVPRGVRYRPARCDGLLGYSIPAAEQAATLRRLECAVDEGSEPVGRGSTGDGLADGVSANGSASMSSTAEWIVTPPSFRPDLEREVDLIEEAGRIAGYELSPETLPRHRTAGGLTRPQQVRRAIRRALAGCGLDEVITYSFIAPDALTPLGLPEGDVRLDPVRLSNPMSVEQSAMRTMLLPGLLGAVRDNIDRQNDPPNLFEIGKVFLWDEPVPAPAHAAEPGAVLPHEPEAVGIVLSGPLEAENWTGVARPTDFYTLKGVVDAMLAAVRLRGDYAPLGDAAAQFPYLHPGKSALVGVARVGGTGVVGQLRPDVAAAYGIEDLAVYVASLVGRFVPIALAAAAFADLGAYPPATQDLAVVVARDVPSAVVVDQARRAGGRLVQSVRVFDVYEGDQVPEGKRSLALRLVMRSPERTLNDKDITAVRHKVLQALEREFGAALR
ncbi:MAG TPA: phenylalanine--tRNA ligase subunit beta [Thermoleophilia bacterium]|nr:phenylalanine--tRNA ligase subunit beta [Thermoleophilia bacterium]